MAHDGSWGVLGSVEKTLDALSVVLLVLSAEGKVLKLNTQACKDFHLDRKEDILSVPKLTDWLSVCQGDEGIISDIPARLEYPKTYEDLPAWTCIRLYKSGIKFYVEGRFIGRYD